MTEQTIQEAMLALDETLEKVPPIDKMLLSANIIMIQHYQQGKFTVEQRKNPLFRKGVE